MSKLTGCEDDFVFFYLVFLNKEVRSLCTYGIHNRVSIDTLNGPSMDTGSILDQHSIDISVNSWLRVD